MEDIASKVAELKKLRDANAEKYDEWAELKRENKNILIEKPQPKKINRTGNEYRLRPYLTRGVIMNERYRKIFNDKTSLYYFLQANIIRAKMSRDTHDIYNKYYKKYFLACHFTDQELTECLNTTKYQIRKWLQELEQDGVIKIDKLQKRYNYTPRVFILGTYYKTESGKPVDKMYLEDVLGM